MTITLGNCQPFVKGSSDSVSLTEGVHVGTALMRRGFICHSKIIRFKFNTSSSGIIIFCVKEI